MNIRIPKSVLISVGILLLVVAGAVIGVMATGVTQQDKSASALGPAATQPLANVQLAATASASPRASTSPVPTVTKTETQTPAYVPVPVPVPERTKYVPQPYPVTAGGSWHSIATLEGSNVFIRSAPSTGSAVVGQVPTGASVHVSCYVIGESVSGNVFWNRVNAPYYGYVADRFVDGTGSVPPC
jgi:Bacterial SH3 domain